MKKRNAALKSEDQALTDKAGGSKKNMYARMLGDETRRIRTTDRRGVPVPATTAAAAPTRKAAEEGKGDKTKPSGPFRRRSNLPNEESSKKQREGSSRVRATRPRSPQPGRRIAATATTTTNKTVRVPPPSSASSPSSRPSLPPRRVTPPRSSQRNVRVRSPAPRSSPKKQSQDRHEAAASSGPEASARVPTTGAAKITTATGSEARASNPPARQQATSPVVVQGSQLAPPASAHVVPSKEVRIARQGDWLSMLIPDHHDDTGAAPTDGSPAADFSNDFCSRFDNHNDSDSVTWDPHAEVMSSFVLPAGTVNETAAPSEKAGDACARDEVDTKPLSTSSEIYAEAREGTDPNELVPLLLPTAATRTHDAALAEAAIFRSSPHNEPPLSTVLVCKVTTAGTAATTSRSASSSGSTTSSADGSQDEVRGDAFNEDGVSDMETEGVEEKKVPEATAVNVGSPRASPPRPARQIVQASAPEPQVEEIQRRLSFSSLQMMLDKHSTTRHEVIELESLEDWLGTDDDDEDTALDDEERDPDIVMDGREDTYSFIGADYSFGADRSLISLLPMK